MRLDRTVRCLALCVALASSALANTYVVDVNGSGQFTDIPPAIATAASGDVLVVLAGSYGAFTLDKALTIVGVGAVNVGGGVRVTAIAAGQRAVLVGFTAAYLRVDESPGAVIAQEITGLLTAQVADCSDVRLRLVDVQATLGPYSSGLSVFASRVELADSNSVGNNPPPCSSPPYGPDGGPGLEMTNASRVHVALSNCIGGDSGDCSTEYYYCGGGGSGIQNSDGTLILTGGGASQIQGGHAGINWYYAGCDHDGGGGTGIYSFGPIWYSGATIVGQSSTNGLSCTYFPGVAIASNAPVHADTPDDPTLDLVGTPTAGTSVQFVLRAPSGSTATLDVGRAPILVADGLALIEQLAPHARVVHLGTVPASGQRLLTWNIPAGLPTGTLIVAQAETVLPGGELRRTNSLPIVVR